MDRQLEHLGGCVKARFNAADGRVLHEERGFERTAGQTHYALLDEGGVKWFADTGQVSHDGWLILREDAAPDEAGGRGLPKA